MTMPQQPAPPPGDAGQDALVLAVASALLTASTVDAAVQAASSAVKVTGAAALGLRAALGIVMSFPPAQDSFYGQAGQQAARQNLLRRAQFTVSAAKRLSQDVSRAISARQPVAAALSAGIDRERRFYGSHLLAIWNRTRAAAQTDTAVMTYGDLLGWATVLDTKTSKDCRDANGKNYYASAMPVIGYPGAVHPHCRCYPTSPYRNGKILPSYGKLRRANSPQMARAA
jgi:hypothetical protein